MSYHYKSHREYLNKKSHLDAESGCIVWDGIRSADGYGHVDMKSMRNAGIRTAHRANWLDLKGEIPAGYEIDHVCRNRACINVDHLRCVTRAENMAGRVHGGNPAIGQDHQLAKLTDAKVIEIRKLRSSGIRLSAIASTFGISESLVSLVASRKKWGHVA